MTNLRLQPAISKQMKIIREDAPGSTFFPLILPAQMKKRKNKSPLPVFESVEISDAGSEGMAIARAENRVIFVPFGVPGDVVDIQVVRKKKSFFEGKIIRFHHYSELRMEPVCEHFGVCGGCRWQHMEYRHQLQFKHKQVKDNFDRIGKFPYPEINPIIGSEPVYFYRNKLEYTFSNRKWFTGPRPEFRSDTNANGLGFHLPGMFDRILDIEKCHLQADPSNEIRLAVRRYALDHQLSFYDVKTWEGLLRNLVIRNTMSGQLMVIMVFREHIEEIIQGLMSFIQEHFPMITSLMYTINPKKNDDISDLAVSLFHGQPYLIEELPSFLPGQQALKFKIGPVSFFQTNSAQASILYRTAAQMAYLKGNETVYDLYSGTGTIACYLAPMAAKVIGIEYIGSAVDDARENARINGITNASFHAGDLAKVLNPEFFATHGRPDVIITDPPRSGMHENVVRQIVDAAPEKVVYISCNPATQARDIALMADFYQVTAVQPVDMFPHTQHVENVVLLVRTGHPGQGIPR
jgi:23S rRNA (uracil1939-C5)-methyltransferase